MCYAPIVQIPGPYIKQVYKENYNDWISKYIQIHPILIKYISNTSLIAILMS